MILRSVARHVREQNWTAIGIDFVIVVLGVFVGIQVANWNEDRVTQRKAAVVTERLKADLRDEAWGYEMQIGYHGQVLVYARQAADALAGQSALSDEALLIAAFRGTQYNVIIRRRATYDELTSTGELGLIGDRALRQLAMDVYTSPMFDWVVDEGRGSQYRQAFRKRVPHDVQAAVSARCGDRQVLVGDYAGIATMLDHPCRTGLPPATLAAAAAALRNDPDILPLLRLRIADVESNVANLTYYIAMRQALRDLARKTK